MPAINANGHEIHYSESRDSLSRRPPLVLIHGAGGQHVHWPPHLRRLPDTTVYAPDLPGHGKSEGEGRNTVTAYAADVLAFMDALGLRRAVVGGHSMGGAIALTMAIQWPDRLAGLLLVGTGARLRVLPEILNGLQTDFEATVDRVLDLSYGGTPSEQVVRVGRRQLLACGAEVMHRDYSACNIFDLMGRLGEIRAPALVLVGDEDQLTPVNYARYLAENIPDAQLEIVGGAGHMLPIESPQEVASLVETWLGGLAS